MAVESNKYNRKKELAIANLMQTPNIGDAAEATGIAKITLVRWLQDKDFRDLYREAQRQAVGAAIGRLQYATSEAVQALISIIKDESASTSARVTAARTVLEMGLKGFELQDLEERILVLEGRLDNKSWQG